MPTHTNEGSAIVTLPAPTQICITRQFNAPPELVYRAWTTPELVRRWWSARRGAVTEATIDLRVGGRWRWVMTTDDGTEVAFHGEYRELVPAARIVCTEVFEALPDGEALNTLDFQPAPSAGTLLTLLVQHSCQEHRDAHINSGMEAGMQDALDLLELAVSELTAAAV